MTYPLIPHITQPGEGKILQAFGHVFMVLLDGRQTDNALTVITEIVPPDGRSPLHSHKNEDEIFLVIEGKMNYRINEQWTEVAPGGLVFLPKGTAHCFQNLGITPGRHWIITMPAGFENFIMDTSEEWSKQSNPDQELISQIHLKHGIELG